MVKYRCNTVTGIHGAFKCALFSGTLVWNLPVQEKKHKE